MLEETYSVVLVDDHPIVLAGIKALVEASGLFVLVGEASHAQRGLEIILRAKPDIAVIDLSMPGMNGVELVKRLAEQLPATKVLVLTVHEETAYVQQVLRAGGKGYVLKRSASEELIRALKAVASGGVYIDPAVAGRMLGAMARPAQGAGELSPREQEVLQSVARGLSNKEIAARMSLSIKTVETYKARAMEKLEFRTRADLVLYASAQGWISEAN